MLDEGLRYAHDEGLTDVCFSSDGEKIITCGSDGDVRIWPRDERQDPVHVCIGEYALSVCHKDNSIYVSTSNKDIQTLTYPEGDREGVFARYANQINQIAITKKSKLMALAAEDMHVKVINLDDSSDVKCFNCDNATCLSVAISPDGKMVAGSFGDGRLRIWDTNESQLLKEIDCFPKVNSISNAETLCRIDFDSNKNQFLAYPQNNSIIILKCDDWTELTRFTEESVSVFSIVQFSPCSKYILGATTEGDFVAWNFTTRTVTAIGKHPNKTAVCGLAWDPKGTGKIVYTDKEGQLGSMLLQLEKQNSASSAVNETHFEIDNNVDFEGVQFEDDDEDNENAISLEELKKQYMDDPRSDLDAKSELSIRAVTPRPVTPVIPLQKSFMPSSTPEHLDPRYLCWNEVGIIRSYGAATDDDVKYIEVEFHDSSFHNSMTLQNFNNYSMGSLNKSCIVVANGNQITSIPLSAGAGNKDWMLKVEEPEEIVTIASSENIIALALSNYFVHVTTTYGTQRSVFSVPGPIVCMSAHNNSLLIAYHSAGIRTGDQCVSILLVKFVKMKIHSRELNSALGPEATLFWLGFSDLGTPAMMDSLGTLSLYPEPCNIWIPFCNTSKHCKSMLDKFFVTAISESLQVVYGIKCRGSCYPCLIPRPTICELPLQPPFVEDSLEKTQMESSLFAWSTLRVSDIEKKYKQTSLKVFALACQNDLDRRAVEFMELISDPQVVTLGIKYALKLDKKLMVQKLMNLASEISANEDLDPFFPENQDDAGHVEIKTIKPLNQIRLLKSGKSGKSKQKQHEVSGPVGDAEAEVQPAYADESISHSVNVIDTQESSVVLEKSLESKPKNPFAKNLKKDHSPAVNPLSLTDKFAGYDYKKESKENIKSNDVKEKRKKPDSADAPPLEQPKEKQRKLDKFLFSKN